MVPVASPSSPRRSGLLSRAAALAIALLVSSLLALPAAAQPAPPATPAAGATPAASPGPPEQAPACRAVTPVDAPVGCLEIFPLGASARVTWDGVDRGLSPTGIPNIEPGTHTLRLDRAGSYPWVGKVEVAAGEARRLDPPLAPIALVYPAPGPAEPYPLAVMVENHPAARPQWGLDKADIVYEALAEGGISRFLAIYITQEAEVIGPVRSTRHYFVYAAAEFNASLVHVGASPIGYAALAATGIRNVNESYGDPGIWRSVRRDPPHDAFTSTADARAAADGKGPGGPGSWGPLVFKTTESPTQAPPATAIRIDYPPGGWYDVRYRWDPTREAYLRWMDGERHLDGNTGEQLAARNVIIQVVPDEVIDREGRLDLAQTGEGKAYYFIDGTVMEGIWTKADMGSRTFFWDTAGNLVRVNAVGTTWIQIVPPEAVITIS